MSEDAKGVMPSLRSSLKFLNRDLRLILTSYFIGSFGDGLYSYLLPYYMKETLAVTSVEVGILYSSTTLSAALTLFIAGILADRYDRKKIMIAGWMVWAPAPLIFSLSKDWLQMLPGMILWGFWLGGPTIAAYIITSAESKNLTLIFTTVSAAWFTGYIFSPALGGYISKVAGMRAVFYLAFSLYVAAAITLLFIKSQRARWDLETSRYGILSSINLLKERRVLALSIFFTSMMFLVNSFRPFIPQFLHEVHGYGDLEIGLLGSSTFTGAAVIGIVLGRLGDRRGKGYALASAMLLCSLSLSLLILFRDFTILLPTLFILGGNYTIWSLMNALMGPLAPDAFRARWVSIPQTLAMSCSFFAPYIGGLLYEISPYYPFLLAIALTPLIAIIAVKKFS